METATLIMMMAGFGLLLLMGWTLYRIQSHRKRMRTFDETALEIGSMTRSDPDRYVNTQDLPPTIPSHDMLIVLFRNKKRPWREAVSQRMRKGAKVMVVSSRPPSELRNMYPDGPLHIWLDRSTAHELDQNTIVVNPTNLSSLLEEVRSHFVGNGEGGIVVFEGFEEVLSSNDTERVMRFLKMLRQTSKDRNISAVVPLPYKAVAQRVRNQLMEGFESVVID